jgi:5-(carboxyamino)imidazole ribonucleotide synthase
VLTIEIEHVNTDALHTLEQQGKTVHPAPCILEIIKDKGRQKEFYRQHGIPTAPFEIFQDEKALKEAIQKGDWSLPLVQKARTAGYDGRGVAILRSVEDLDSKILPGACLAETRVDVQAELAVMVARNANDEVAIFPPVEMDFHPEANLVELLICPARVSPLIAAEAEALAERVIRAFDLCGLLAVELFLTTGGELLVNEVAPRPHNSGHHTIDSAFTSQYQQHLRAICNLPLGSTVQVTPAVMVNLLGEPGFNGPVQYLGVEECLAIPGVYVHLYGKARTSPFRKMGHVTVTAPTIEAAIAKANVVRATLKVVSANTF